MPNLWIPDKSNFHKVEEFPLLEKAEQESDPFQKLKIQARRLEGRRRAER